MSKLLKRMPWEVPPERDRPRTPMRPQDLPEGALQLLSLVPRRNPKVEWEEEEGSGMVTLIYPKRFSAFERGLARVVKPVEEIRRPLDAPGSDIWRLCDGRHSIADICSAVDDRYKERMEPVLKRVVQFIEMLAQRGLVVITRVPDEGEQEG